MMVTRRQFMHWLGVSSTGLVAAAACSPATPAAAPTAAPKAAASTSAPAAPTSAPAIAPAAVAPTAAPDFTATWDALVDAAKKEGKLAVNTFPGTGYRQALSVFSERFPGISIDHTTMIAREVAVRVIPEQKAGVYAFDVTQMPATTALSDLLPAGAWDPIRPVIIHPEVTDDKYWRGGFERGLLDNSKQFGYGFAINKSQNFWINTDLIKPGEIQNAKDLLDPRFKGKMVLMDPRSGGFTAGPLTPARKLYGDDFLKSVLVDQEPVITRDQRQATEMLIRGGMAIATGPTDILIDDFKNSGVTVNVGKVMFADATTLAGGSVWLFKKAPNPNAAKLFINWLLTKEGQTTWNQMALLENSRRTDVAPVLPERYPTDEEIRTLTYADTEIEVEEIAKTQKLSAELLK
ncbi:MAG: ABC transporter substrate-binding protein [Chloroflexota bacterium]